MRTHERTSRRAQKRIMQLNAAALPQEQSQSFTHKHLQPLLTPVWPVLHLLSLLMTMRPPILQSPLRSRRWLMPTSNHNTHPSPPCSRNPSALVKGNTRHCASNSQVFHLTCTVLMTVAQDYNLYKEDLGRRRMSALITAV